MDVLAAALDESDGFLRYKVVTALERLRREGGQLNFPRETIEKLTLAEGRQYFNYLSLRYNLFGKQALPADSLLARALDQKIERIVDRIFRLLALIVSNGRTSAPRAGRCNTAIRERGRAPWNISTTF